MGSSRSRSRRSLDFRADLADAAQQEPDAEALGHFILRGLSGLIPFDSSSLFASQMPERPASINKEAYRGLYDLLRADAGKILTPVRARTAGLHAYLDNEVFTAHERQNLALYRQVIRPQGITNQLCAWLRFRGRTIGVLNLCRNGRVGKFDRKDLGQLEALLASIEVSLVAMGMAGGTSLDATLAGNAGLTPRERDLAGLICRGLGNREIALLLGTAPNTVRNQLHLVYEKLGLSGRTELAVWATRRRPS